jgi:hypothetical protein
MPDKGQKELGDLLKEGAAALIQMRKGIENACAELRAVYSERTLKYLRVPEQDDALTSQGGANNLLVGKKLPPSAAN